MVKRALSIENIHRAVRLDCIARDETVNAALQRYCWISHAKVREQVEQWRGQTKTQSAKAIRIA